MLARTMGTAAGQHEAPCGLKGIISTKMKSIRHSGNSESKKDVLILQGCFLETRQIRRPDVLSSHSTIVPRRWGTIDCSRIVYLGFPTYIEPFVKIPKACRVCIFAEKSGVPFVVRSLVYIELSTVAIASWVNWKTDRGYMPPTSILVLSWSAKNLFAPLMVLLITSSGMPCDWTEIMVPGGFNKNQTRIRIREFHDTQQGGAQLTVEESNLRDR